MTESISTKPLSASLQKVNPYLYLIDSWKFGSCFADFFEVLYIAKASFSSVGSHRTHLLTNWTHPPT